jgi:hypothetical protein
MNGKKITVIAASAFVAFAFLAALVVGGIVGVFFYSTGNSEAALTAKEFLRGNERLERDIGEVRGFGWFMTHDLQMSDGREQANFNLKAIGARQSVNASVMLRSSSDGTWRVVGASYTNDVGRRIELLRAERRIAPEQIFGPSDGETTRF